MKLSAQKSSIRLPSRCKRQSGRLRAGCSWIPPSACFRSIELRRSLLSPYSFPSFLPLATFSLRLARSRQILRGCSTTHQPTTHDQHRLHASTGSGEASVEGLGRMSDSRWGGRGRRSKAAAENTE
jgi:hypothetical protein